MKKFVKLLVLAVAFGLLFAGCKHNADAGKTKTGKASEGLHGIAKDKNVSVTIKGKSYLVQLDAKTGKCKIVSGSSSRAADGNETDAEFEYYNGRLTIKSDEDLGDLTAEEDDPLYITFTVDDIESEEPTGDEDSVKTCNDSDMADESADADAKVDFETEEFVNQQIFDPYALPKRVGTNYFKGKKIYSRKDSDSKDGTFTKDELLGEITEDDFWGRDYSYKVEKDDDDYAVGLLYWKNRWEADVDAVQNACLSVENFQEWLGNESNLVYFDGLKIDAALGTYGSVQKYLRAYYGLSDESADDEVITVYFRNFLEKVNRERHVEMHAFWFSKITGKMNLIMTTEPGLTYREQYEINNPWPLQSKDRSYAVYPGGQSVMITDGPTPQGLNGTYNIIGVTDNIITFIDTLKDWPVRYDMEYKELEYKPEWTGYFEPDGNSWQNEITDGVSGMFKCEAIWGDTDFHFCSSGSGFTNIWYVEGEYDYCTVTYNKYINFDDKIVQYSKGDISKKLLIPTKSGYTFEGWYIDEELSTAFDGNLTKDITLYAKWETDAPQEDDTPVINVKLYTLEDGKKLTEKEDITFTRSESFYSYNLESYKTLTDTNDVISFKLSNTGTENKSYMVHMAWVDTIQVVEFTPMKPGESKTYTFKIADLITFWGNANVIFQLEIICDDVITVTEGKILTIEDITESE